MRSYNRPQLAEDFAEEVERIEALLARLGARLMPTGMHPWMDPSREFQVWPHGGSQIYQAFDRIFDCRGHGWANLQSAHINLPFGNDEEFARLRGLRVELYYLLLLGLTALTVVLLVSVVGIVLVIALLWLLAAVLVINTDFWSLYDPAASSDPLPALEHALHHWEEIDLVED